MRARGVAGVNELKGSIDESGYHVSWPLVQTPWILTGPQRGNRIDPHRFDLRGMTFGACRIWPFHQFHFIHARQEVGYAMKWLGLFRSRAFRFRQGHTDKCRGITVYVQYSHGAPLVCSLPNTETGHTRKIPSLGSFSQYQYCY